MQVTCPSCRSQIPSADMNLANLVAKCRKCDNLIDLSSLLPGNRAGRAPVVNAGKAPLPRPRGLKIDDSGPVLRIVHSWFWSGVILAVLFCIGWDSTLVFWYPKIVGGNVSWREMVPLVIHVLFSILLTYSALAGFINRTVVTVDREKLTIREGPLPCFGNRSLPIESIARLCTQQVAQETKWGVSYKYDFCAVTKDGYKVVLIQGILDIDVSLFIEQAVESYLGIEHRLMLREAS